MPETLDSGKRVWTQADFDKMSFHDLCIHGIAAVHEYPDPHELLFDIDYILEWVKPRLPGKDFKFRLAPATLVFEHVYDLAVRTESGIHEPWWSISDVTREKRRSADGRTDWAWSFGLEQGNILFRSTGFKLFLRKAPSLSERQYLSFSERGGVSFARGS